MSQPDDLLLWLERVNPVQDPLELEDHTDSASPLRNRRKDEIMTDLEVVDKAMEKSGLQRRRGLVVGAATVVAAILLGAIALLVPSREGLVAGERPGPLDAYVSAVQDGDVETALALVEEEVPEGVTAFFVAAGISGVEFSECQVLRAERVQCDVVFGPSDYPSLMIGTRSETRVFATVGDGTLTRVSWAAPRGLPTAENRFWEWISETHPDRLDEMFNGYGDVKLDEASGEARRELLNQYLAARD